MVKWEYEVLPLKTKVHVSRHEREKNPTIDKVQKELNALGEGRMGVSRCSEYSPRNW